MKVYQKDILLATIGRVRLDRSIDDTGYGSIKDSDNPKRILAKHILPHYEGKWAAVSELDKLKGDIYAFRDTWANCVGDALLEDGNFELRGTARHIYKTEIL